MTSEELKSSAEWSEDLDVRVVNPDGWDRSNFDYDWNRPISRVEFVQKAGMSTLYIGEWDD